jgi:lactaldehyde dehydrogenase / glycolaldehyde dehydrogenase
VPKGTRGHVDAAVNSCSTRSGGLGETAGNSRAAYLQEIAQLIRANKEALARRITEEQGKVLLLEGRPALGRRSRSFS